MAIPQIPDWRERILAGVGVQATPENLRFFDAWARAEGGGATNNPFNTTQTMPNATAYNSVGVRNYGTAAQGIDATVDTLTNGRYGNIIGALRKGDSAMSAAQALADSPWGTGALVEKILGGPVSPDAAQGGSSGGSSTFASSGAQLNLPTIQAPDPTLGGQTQSQTPSPAQRLGDLTTQLLQQAQLSPGAVKMLSALGDATKTVTSMRQAQQTAMTSLMPLDQPIIKTLGTLQTGSTDSKYRTLDLGKDFDGPVHPNAQPIVHMAMQYLGTPYLWGGADPRKGFDCSGFVQYLYSQAGIALPRTTYGQVKVGQAVQDPNKLLPGDIVLFATENGKAPTHEGLYIGGGQFIHAPHTGDVVKISSLTDQYYASRFLVGRRVIDNPQPPEQPTN